MTEVRNTGMPWMNGETRHRRGAAAWLRVAAAAALLLVLSSAAGVPQSAGPPGGLPLHAEPKPLPELRFQDSAGRPLSLADFRGRVVLLNIWATWCATCRHEMPTLDRLQAVLGGRDFEVVALSIDRSGHAVVRRFYNEAGIGNLTLYIDPTGAASRTLGVAGLPTTLLIDRDGRELDRYRGPAVWDSEEMVAFLRSIIARPDGAVDRRPSG